MEQSVEGFITCFHYRHDTDHILVLIYDQESEKEVEELNANLLDLNVYKNMANQCSRQGRARIQHIKTF